MSSTRWSSKATPSGRAGLVPVAMTMLSGADGGVFGLVVVLEENGVRVEESAVAGVEIDRVAPQLGSHNVDLPADHVCGAGMQVGVVMFPLVR